MGIFSGFMGGSSVDFSGAEGTYDKAMQQIMALLKQSQATGRGDIQSGLATAFGVNAPYTEAGKTALSAYLNSLGVGTEGAQGEQKLSQKFMQSPGYQYALQQAQNAATRRAAATGQTLSGAEQRELSAQSQGMAQQDWGNYLANYQNRLSDIAGIGQRSVMQEAGLSTQAGSEEANLGLSYAGLSGGYMSDMAKAKAEAQMAEQMQKSQSQNNFWGSLGSLAGAAGGFMLGGPMGAMAGYQLGGNLGGGAKGNLFGSAGANAGANTNWLNNWQNRWEQGKWF